MLRKMVLLALVLLGMLVLATGWFYAVGSGLAGGGPWQSLPVTAGPRPAIVQAAGEPQILFGDLHTHTNYSLDAYVFNTALMKDVGVVTPADACDYARYCSALDFWSINDHAEGLTPRVWADTVDAVRACNANAGDAQFPDMVSFVGWEWSNGNSDDVPSHYGHKNVIFRTWEEGATPTRPIASARNYIFTRVPAPLLGLISLAEDLQTSADMGWYFKESRETPTCAANVPVRDLPDDCREVAATPSVLYRKLDEWALDSLVIPHGLAWGTTNPLTADFRNQLDEYEARYQRLLETYSGHGNSERYEDFQRIAVDDSGDLVCPDATPNFTPCCQQAAQIIRARCDDPASAQCAQEIESTVSAFLQAGPRKGRNVVANATLDDWAGCGQLQNTFQPASMYVPRQSTQYNLALGFDAQGRPRRARFGLIGSSDNHLARPGNSYKEVNRRLATDNKSVSGEPTWSYTADRESGSFYYTGGLVAVHANGRHRDAIWQGLEQRHVYATSGDRTLVWFDLLNGPAGQVPMGSEVVMSQTPRFRVKALGAFEQQPGCPGYARSALGDARVASLCGGQCYHPADRRKPVERIEIVRIRPQVDPTEPVAALIDHRWKVFDCAADGTGCSAEFDDPEFASAQRPALYYARVLQRAEPLISGDPFGCQYDDAGNCIERRYCIDENAPADEDCLSPAEPHAWTSPIYVDYVGAPRTDE